MRFENLLVIIFLVGIGASQQAFASKRSARFEWPAETENPLHIAAEVIGCLKQIHLLDLTQDQQQKQRLIDPARRDEILEYEKCVQQEKDPKKCPYPGRMDWPG